MTRFLAAIVIGLTVLLAGCAVTPVSNEFPLQSGEVQVPPKRAGWTYVLIFNNASKLMHGFDQTSKTNVSLNGKGVARLDIGQYVQLTLPNDQYVMELVHKDAFLFTSEHMLVLDGEPVYVEVSPTAFSHSVKLHKSLPTGNYMPIPFVPLKP